MDNCKNGNHDLIIIFCSVYDYIGNIEAVVRWCKTCGAVVVDADFDNRTKPGDIMKMKFPKILSKG